MQILRFNNVGRKFHKQQSGDFWALRNIYMAINEGEIVGVMGRNGSGKTTLLNIIAGTLPLSEGEAVLSGKVSALLTLGAGFQDEFTGRENIYLHASLLGMTKQEIERRFAAIVEFSELGDFINAPLGSYSAGMKMRLGFSIAAHNDFDVLVTDEIIAVGDIYFQKKSFEKMAEFKKQNKAMIIASQDLRLMQRFCDRAYLLEDGKIIFDGTTNEAIERYEKLLSKKKVLSESSRLDMVKETKRWATDIVDWGRKEGTGEISIEKVTILNNWGIRKNIFRTGDKIKARVCFKAGGEVDNFHFGIAIFREDGVYCYGPNTKFDGLALKRMHKGKGYFEFECQGMQLMPGIYYLSVAIWDENETFAYDYHRCGYKITIVGPASFGQLLSMQSKWQDSAVKGYPFPNLDYLEDKWGTELNNGAACLKSIRLLDGYGGEDSVFITGKGIKIKVDFEIGDPQVDDMILWLGVYRSDGIYCHGNVKQVSLTGANSEILFYPKLNLLPGGYRVSAGIWDVKAKKFLTYSHGIGSFNMISEKRDHGTIYLEHRWNCKVPQKKESR